MKKNIAAVIATIGLVVGYAEARFAVVIEKFDEVKTAVGKAEKLLDKFGDLESELPSGTLDLFKQKLNQKRDSEWKPKAPLPPAGALRFFKKSSGGISMKTYTVDEALALIMGTRPGARICSLVTQTVPRLYAKHPERGDPNPYRGRLVKIAERSGMIRVSYRNAVNNQRVREGRPVNRNSQILPFKAGSLWHGRGEHDTAETVRHAISGRRYLTFKPKTDERGDVIVRRELCLLDGKPIDVSDVQEWLKPASRPRNQGIRRVVRWRTIPLESVVQITCGELYVIRHPAELKRSA